MESRGERAEDGWSIEQGGMEGWGGKSGRKRKGNKNKTKVGEFHGLLTAERNSKRRYSPAGTLDEL